MKRVNGSALFLCRDQDLNFLNGTVYSYLNFQSAAPYLCLIISKGDFKIYDMAVCGCKFAMDGNQFYTILQ